MSVFRNNAAAKTKLQLYKELKETRAKLKLLEQALEGEKAGSGIAASASPNFPTPPKDQTPPESSDSAVKSDETRQGSSSQKSSKMCLRGRKGKSIADSGKRVTPVSGRRTNLRKRTLAKSIPTKELKS